MSTAEVTSNTNLPNFGVSNSIVTQSAVADALPPAAYQTVQFGTITNLPVDALILNQGDGVLEQETIIYDLDTADYVQLVANHEVYYGGNSTYTPYTSFYINVGTDTLSNAEALITLFNLSNSNPFVIAHFKQWCNPITGPASTPSVVNLSLLNPVGNTGTQGTYITLVGLSEVVDGYGLTTLFNNAGNTCVQTVPVRIEYGSPTNVIFRVLTNNIVYGL